MKICPYCKIEVGGDLSKCPLCQSKLTGEGGEAYFPKPMELKIKSLFYKIQLFIVWVVIIAALGLDFLFDLRIAPFPNVRYSLLIAMWLIVLEFLITRKFKAGGGSARIVTLAVFPILIMLSITAYFLGFWRVTMDWIVPIAITATMIANYVLAMIEKQGNAMTYLLTNLLVGALPYIVLHFRHKDTPITWIICILVSVILFIGAVIFKGREVSEEFRRRLNV